MRTTLFCLLCLTGTAFGACKQQAPKNTSEPLPTATTTPAAATPSTQQPANSANDKLGPTGIKECDEYLAKLADAVKNAPEHAKPFVQEQEKLNRPQVLQMKKTGHQEADQANAEVCGAMLNALDGLLSVIQNPPQPG